MKKRVAILGASGSIGKSALDVLSRCRDDFEIVLLSAHTDSASLEKAGMDWPQAALALSGAPAGGERLLAAIGEAQADIVINGIAGAAGLLPSIAALKARAVLACANKETLVMAGPLVLDLAAQNNAALIPVDSEHSAVFHLIKAHCREDCLEEIILTASGGPFKNYTLEELKAVRPEAALSHPTWNMGTNITIDSASMANKGLEVIEASRLFGLPPEKIKVAIHPQSIVHSMIRLRGGAVYAELSRPDMRQPIHAALYWPHQPAADFGRLDFDALTLDFSKPDTVRFPMLRLAYQALKQGGLYPCAYNAANEAARAAFLEGRLGFLDIARIADAVLEEDWSGDDRDLATVLETDKKARTLAKKFICD
jgi:1-deoxy-D-xylulose-5-phosphate reductoisomerase